MILERIKEMLQEFNDFDPAALTSDTTFTDLGLDSLDVVDLIMKIDQEFGTTIQLDGGLKTLGDVVKLIETQKA